jgi:uncharacterized membrane protein
MGLELLLRYLHIYSAVLLAGGFLFLWLVFEPAVRGVAETERNALLERIRGRWSKVVMLTTLLLLVSGLVNAVRFIKAYDFTGFPGGLYHFLVALKLVLALAVFFISATLVGRSENARRFREKLGFWLMVNGLLMVVLVAIGGLMKVSTREPKTNPATATAPAVPSQADLDRGALRAIRSIDAEPLRVVSR